MNKLLRRLGNIMMATMLVLSSGLATAADTEIYFSSASTSTVRPNLLIIMDTSGSMGWSAPDSPGDTRMDVLRIALTSLITSLTNVNMGLMRFTSGEGGPVLYPIKDLDAYNRDTVSEPDDLNAKLQYTIDDGVNDGEQNLTTGDVDLASVSLDLTDVPAVSSGSNTLTLTVAASSDDAWDWNGSASRTSGTVYIYDNGNENDGLRFTNVTIPQGATINSAYLELTARSSTSSSASVRLTGHDVDNSGAFSGVFGDVQSRTRTTAAVTWNGVSPAVGGSVTTFPEMKDIVQEIVDRPGWASGNAMSIIMDNMSGYRYYYSYDGTSDASRRPRLVVDYVVSTTTAPAYSQKVALRFPEIDIPQGSTISSASLVFTAAQSDSATTNWTIQAEKSASSATLTTANNDIGARALTTASVAYNNVPAWTADSTYATPDLATVVQEVVDDPAWCGGLNGSALTFIISGNGLRVAKSNETVVATGGTGAIGLPQLNLEFIPNPAGCLRAQTIKQVATYDDDSEERVSDGQILWWTSPDLDLGIDWDNAQRLIGLRWRDIDIPQGAIIESATVDLVAYSTSSSTISGGTITGFKEVDTAAFTTGNSDISSRPTTTASVAWTPPAWNSVNETQTTPDIAAVIQEIVDQPSWAPGNALGIRLTATSGSRRAYTYDTSPSRAAILRVIYRNSPTSTTPIAKTVRQRLIELVQALPATGATPIIETLYEAAHYWRGESVVFGLDREYYSYNRVSHPGSYCVDGTGSATSCNGANTGTYPPYGVYRQSGCTDDNLNSGSCYNERIYGSPTYISPFGSSFSCESNYQILITDGEANSLGSTTVNNIRSEYLSGNACDTTRPDGSSVTSSELCGIDLARYLATQDQSTTLDNDQIVKTYTVGLDFCPSGRQAALSASSGAIVCCDSTQIVQPASDADTGLGTCPTGASATTASNALRFLNALAEEGGGFFSEAKNAGQLTNTLQKIIGDIKDTPTSFAAPAITTNFFNRSRSRDQIYYGLFTPEESQKWQGNVKRFRICTDTTTVDPVSGVACTQAQLDSLEIRDVNNAAAVDPATLLFKDSSRSYWSNIDDGSETTRGGAGGELVDYTTRIIVTEEDASGLAASGTSLLDSGFQLNNSNFSKGGTMQHVRNIVCPADGTATETADCDDRMQWLLGKDTLNENSEFPTGHPRNGLATRWSHGDVIHASPVLVTYGFVDTNPGTPSEPYEPDGVADNNDLIDKLLTATNDGGLRMLDASTGKEDWIFMPNRVLQQQTALYSDGQGEHIYGLDITPVVRYIDNNKDGVIDPATPELDKVHVYLAMRRGGSNLYALDITPTAKLTSSATVIPPKMLWRIEGGSGDFVRLADTWSKPVRATIQVRSSSGSLSAREVLIFGGGYDTGLDGPDIDGAFGADAGEPNNGNAIFIVDADTGQRLFWASHASFTDSGGTTVAGSGADIAHPEMRHSIPAEVTLLDTNQDGFDDRIYVADTGGQIWRIDLGADIMDDGTGLDASVATSLRTVMGRTAAISQQGVVANERRFFNRITALQVVDTKFSNAPGGRYTYLLVTSGYRAHPLNRAVTDRYYAFRDLWYGKLEEDGSSNLADSTFYKTIAESDMIDVSDTSTVTKLDPALATHKNSYGYFITFPDVGEKGLSSIAVFFGKVFFTTYSPTAASLDPCSADIGVSFNWAVSLQDGSGVLPATTVGGIQPRRAQLGSGLASDPLPLFTQDGVVVVVGLQQSLQALNSIEADDKPRIYWVEE